MPSGAGVELRIPVSPGIVAYCLEQEHSHYSSYAAALSGPSRSASDKSHRLLL